MIAALGNDKLQLTVAQAIELYHNIISYNNMADFRRCHPSRLFRS